MVTGWLMSSAAGFAVPFFGLFYLPDFIRENDALFQFFAAPQSTFAPVCFTTTAHLATSART